MSSQTEKGEDQGNSPLASRDFFAEVKKCDSFTPSDLWLRKQRTLFNSVDTDRDGLFYKSDLLDLGLRLVKFGGLTAEESGLLQLLLSTWWDEVFAPKDSIEWDTWWKIRFLIGNSPVLTEADTFRHLQKAMQLFFKAVDTNKCGFLTQREWRLFSSAVGVNEAEADACFKEIEKQTDNVMTLKEFLTGACLFMYDQNDMKYRLFFGCLAEL